MPGYCLIGENSRMASLERTAIHMIRAPIITHLACRLEAMGAPVASLLGRAGISAELLAFPDTLIPLANTFKLLELACSSLGTEHLGIDLGLGSSLVDFGDYGKSLAGSLTVGAYMHAGTRHYRCLNSGERLWLSRAGDGDIRINMTSHEKHSLGAHQSHLCTLIVSILTIRQAAGPDWCPSKLGLAYTPREPVPATELLARTHIEYGTQYSYITVPSSLLQRVFPQASRSQDVQIPGPGDPMPTDILEIVTNQVETLYTNRGTPHIDSVAESLSMSRRTLQREIARRGTTYVDIVHHSRMRQACEDLDGSDKTITEIAFELGYTDASNFTRAFRREIGISPSAFRRQALSA